MAKKGNYAVLKYGFIFKTSDNVWNSMYDFERDLIDFFAAHQLEVEPISTVEGGTGERMLIIKKLDEMQMLDNRRHLGGKNMHQGLTPGKAQKSYATVKQLTDSIGHGKRA